MYRTIANIVFWEFDSIIMQNVSDILPLFCTPTWPSHHAVKIKNTVEFCYGGFSVLVQSSFWVTNNQGPVSRKPRELFGPEKPFVKVRPAYSVKLIFSYVVK